MYTQNEIGLVVNQDSSRVPQHMKSLRTLSKKHKIKLVMCEGADLDNEIRELLKNKKLKRIIIGGGDGSVSKTASLVRRKRPKVEIAVLPLGTSNYYAKSLGIDKSIERAFTTAFSQGDKAIQERHICKANSREFLIGVNVGTTSRMFAEVTDAEKERFGRLSYFRGVFRTLRKTTPPDITVKANGKTKKYSSTELVVLNQHVDERVKLTPDVSGTDPYFEIITYGLGNSKLSPLFAVVIFALSLGRNQKYLKRIKTTKATISSSSKVPVAIDGDVIGKLPLKIELIKKPVRFVQG